jgi:hypothetical protein
MKQRLICAAVCIFCLLQARSQTNTFPSTGNAGIGTTGPTAVGSGYATLDLKGTNGSGIRIGQSSTSTDFMIYQQGSSGNVFMQNQANGAQVFMNNGSEVMRLAAGGHLGLGTNSPTGVGSGYTTLDLKGTNGSGLRIGQSSTSTDFLIYQQGSSGNVYLQNQANGAQIFFNNGAEAMRIGGSGNVGIGTNSPAEKLSVNGNISTKKLIVTQMGWSDYVFDSSYQLRPLTEVAEFIRKNKHLPEIPSAKEVEEKGISVGDNQALMLKKIEELKL